MDFSCHIPLYAAVLECPEHVLRVIVLHADDPQDVLVCLEDTWGDAHVREVIRLDDLSDGVQRMVYEHKGR